MSSRCKFLTIVGTGINAQALTCAEYMNQVWPATGIEILNTMQEAISAGPANPIQREETVKHDLICTTNYHRFYF